MLNTPTQVPSTKANTPSQIANTELDTLVQKLLCHPHLKERKWEKLVISLVVSASEWVISSGDVVASERSDFLQSSKIYFQICTNNCKVKVTFDVVFWCIIFHFNFLIMIWNCRWKKCQHLALRLFHWSIGDSCLTWNQFKLFALLLCLLILFELFKFA